MGAPNSKILLIEDNPRNLATARAVCEERGMAAYYAKTYIDAEPLLQGEVRGVITDLMFPYDDAGTLEPHRNLLRKIEQSVRDISEPDQENMPKRDTVLRDLDCLLKTWEGYVALKGSASDRWKREYQEIQRRHAQELEGMPVGPIRNRMIQEQHLELEEAGRKLIPAEQPMGVLVAEKCNAKGLPYVVMTSGHGAHGDITTPVAAHMVKAGLIGHYRGISLSDINDIVKTLEEFDGRIPGREEYLARMREKHPPKPWNPEPVKDNWYTFDRRFITDADKTEKRTWKFAIELLEAERATTRP